MQNGNFEQIDLDIKDGYPVLVGSGIVDIVNSRIDKENRLSVTDSNVYKLYGKLMERFVFKKDDIFYFQAGEESKNYKTLHSIYDFLLDKKADRYTYLLAFGGGVVGDVSAFAASTYMRGIPVIHIPTTLLAMVDSAIGGKTAINYGGFKNIVGSFYQPKLVVCDIDFLDTLKRTEFNSALSEVIKYGIIRDKSLFEFIEKNKEAVAERDKDVLTQIVLRSIKNKADIVKEDEKETGNRALLNFGHTLAHAVESATEYKKYLHGEAVSIGSVFAAQLSFKLGLTSYETVERIKNLLSFFGLPVFLDKNLDPKLLYKIMEKDKKNKNGQLRFVLTKNIGSSIIFEGSDISGVMDVIYEIKGR